MGNKRFRKLKRVLIIVIAVFLFMNAETILTAAKTDMLGFDIVFALDVSLSMKTSDKTQIAKDAVETFVNRLPEKVCRYSLIAYAGEMPSKVGFTSDRQKIIDAVKGISYKYGNTDIPQALTQAVKYLDSIKDSQREQIIILLTDGKVESTREKVLLVSETDKAINAGYKIHTIGLNSDHSVDSAYLKKLSTGTSAIYKIINNSKDIHAAFNEIFANLIQGDMIVPASIVGDGKFHDREIMVDDQVVQVVICLINSNGVECKLKNPNGESVPIPSKMVRVYATNSSYQLMLDNPVEGNWTLSIKGVNNDNIQVSYIKSYDLTAEVSISKRKVKAGENAEIRVKMSNSIGTIEKADFYKGYECTVTLMSLDGTTQQVPLVADGAAFVGYAQFNSAGTYNVSCNVKGKRIEEKTNSISVECIKDEEATPFWIAVAAIVLIIVLFMAIFLIRKALKNYGY